MTSPKPYRQRKIILTNNIKAPPSPVSYIISSWISGFAKKQKLNVLQMHFFLFQNTPPSKRYIKQAIATHPTLSGAARPWLRSDASCLEEKEGLSVSGPRGMEMETWRPRVSCPVGRARGRAVSPRVTVTGWAACQSARGAWWSEASQDRDRSRTSPDSCEMLVTSRRTWEERKMERKTWKRKKEKKPSWETWRWLWCALPLFGWNTASSPDSPLVKTRWRKDIVYFKIWTCIEYNFQT